MVYDQDLKGQVEALIAPWRFSEDEPPFQSAELVAMARVLIDGWGELDIENDVMSWATETFTVYKKKATQRRNLYDQVNGALRLVDTPYSITVDDYGASVINVTASEPACRTMLLRLLDTGFDKSPNVSFRLFDLPAEVRVKIYEMVFAQPESGLNMMVASGGQILALTRNMHQAFRFRDWDRFQYSTRVKKEWLRTRNMSETFAPLLVCRQMYNEAGAIFYYNTRFYCESLKDLIVFLERVPANKRKFITTIATSLDECAYYHTTTPATAFRLLAELPGLKRLDIRIDEQEWLEDQGPDASSLDMPGIKELREVKVDEVDFHGTCPIIEAAIKGDMLKPKPKESEETVDCSKKRKLDDATETVEGSVKVKSARMA